MPAATKAAQNGAAATDAALTQVTESVAAAFSEKSKVAGDMNAALGSAVLGADRCQVPTGTSGALYKLVLAVHDALLASARHRQDHLPSAIRQDRQSAMCRAVRQPGLG